LGKKTAQIKGRAWGSPKPGQIVYLAVDISRLHIFREGKRDEEVKKGGK